MAKVFSIASWNVEHFKGDPARVGRVVDFMADKNPDVFALYEVEGKSIFDELVTRMPGYTFQITEGDQTQEILVGIRKNLTAFITQKMEYKSGTTHMRPGQLVTVRVDDKNYSVLFLHVASGANPRGMGLRDDMVQRAIDFRKALAKQDKAKGGNGQVNYLFLGDLNCMGMKYPFNRNITAVLELQKWDQEAKKGTKDAQIGTINKMRRLPKTHDLSWSNGSGSSIPDSNLDHVFATETLNFKTFAKPDGTKAEVKVTGWTDFVANPVKKDDWIRDFSDHSLLYLEVAD